MVYIILFFAALAAFWISAICGGGASLILIPALDLLLFSSLVPFALTTGTFASSASRIVVFRKHINRRIVYWFVPFSIPAVVAGAWLIKYVNPVYLQFLVGLFLVANFAQLFKSNKKLKNNEKPYPVYVLAIVGFLAGFVSGVTGAIGLLFNRFYLKYGLSKEEIIATRAANEIILHAIKLVIYLVLGLYSKYAMYIGIIVAVASVASSYTIKYLLKYINDFVFKKLGYAAMAFSGAALLITTTNQIIQQDNISITNKNTDETTVNWRKSSFVMEFEWDEGLEIERPVQREELPLKLQMKYDSLATIYTKVNLEKVFTTGDDYYEFYCFKDDKMANKLEFN